MYADEIELPDGETDFVHHCLTVTDKATLRNGYVQ